MDEQEPPVPPGTVRRFDPFGNRSDEELEKILALPESMQGEDVKPGRLIVRTRIKTTAPRSHEPLALVAEFGNVGVLAGEPIEFDVAAE